MSGVRAVLSAADPLVSDHRIGGIPVLPAAAQIDAMLSACDARRPDCRWTLEQVAFRVPLLVVGPEAELEVHTAEDGDCAVRSVRRPEDGLPVVHSTARVSGSPLPPPGYVDVAALRAGCTEHVPLADVGAWREASGIAYGPAYQVIRSAHRGPGRMLLMLRAGDDANAASAPAFVPPALLDSVFQALGMLDGGAAGACLPWYVGRLVARRRISGTVIALVERDEPGEAGGKGGAVRGRATVCNQQGEVLLELDRITLKAAKPVASTVSEAPVVSAESTTTVAAAPAPAPADAEQGLPAVPLMETVVWRKTEVAPAHPAAPEGPVLIVSPHDLRPPTGRHGAHMTPAQLLDGGLDTLPADAAFRDVVYVAPRGLSGEAQVTEALQGVFALVRRLAARPPMADLLIVTSAAHQVAPEDVVDPFMTALWGLGRTLRVEHPRTRVRLVDLGPGNATGPDDHDAAAFWEALGQDRPELARRDDAWYEPSVQPQHTSTTDPVRYDGGRFLITGGMGGIGLWVAEFLADAGCAHLTLVGRTVPDQGEARDRLDRLGARCDLTVVAADVRSLREELAGAARFDGVFHAAGVLRDGLARSLTQEQVDTVLGPKVGGVHALTDLVSGHEQPGFVALFSSVAAVRANLGQSAYAAANAYLDGYAARQRAAGRSWYSLGWGLWTVGMGESIAPKAAAHGIPALTADDGIDLLRTALGRPPAHYVLSAAVKAKDAPMTAVTPESGLWPSLTHALMKVLHLDGVSAEDDLLELGLDSMMAVELAASLTADGLDIDPMVFFERTNVGALLAHLESLPRTAPVGAPAPAAAPAPAPAAAPVPTPAPVPAAAPRTPAAPAARASHISVPPQRPAVAVERPSAATAPGTADSFVPDWDRFRDVAPTVAPAPAAPPVSPPRAPFPTATAAAAAAATPAPAPLSPAPAPAADRVPRRTLPGRLADAPHGRFLDRRIDALSTEDRLIVAKDEYFYEPVIEEATGPRIKFDGRWFLNFASYSYLGLIGHDYIDDQVLRAVERHGTGAHGVRLLAGTLHLHRELELALARFLGTEDAIVFSSGYMANVATVGALVGPGDVVIGDVYNHASILDGYRLSGASVITYAHNDLADLERALRKAGDAGRLVVTDAVFSMDGDVADLPGIVELCERYDAPLMVDEAHSLGVLGATGRGITEHFGIDPARVDVKMGTLSKTVPSAGGYVAGSSDLIFALKNNARGWMFSAAATPAQVAAAKAAIEVMEAAPSLTGELRTRTTRYREQLRALGFDTLASETPVVPIICTSAEQAGAMARLCQQDGLFVQPIVYPAVPRTLPRLRTIVNLSHSDADLDAAVVTLEKAGRVCGLIR
ncbi:aminotransferase class I/II-fold pyridoxal phosphate-dependent enzyme [Streptomyces sp. NBC_01619]|uniref:bifunctional SDR family oxidoreductase/pyridoxal phosphate-dependent aminotransferase family protein n=1 Tax=Streptomyces sp. NBC_01619 TaxID=2975901 RepID=UPI00225697D7|nr:bifunctional SDR family oxidoreductase/pyridoxal phosphate-dependent aminotransferase family protein [Streptomyces sp. NBC_01619]MCX4515032.1 aminotransferase class I/II-fold pyridoxal phosphate-dependent enzyme [Streptomyces sp. NBC_01619]